MKKETVKLKKVSKKPLLTKHQKKMKEFFGYSDSKVREISESHDAAQKEEEKSESMNWDVGAHGKMPGFIKKALLASQAETERQKERMESLGERDPLKVDPTESYGYTKFPAPIMDYLDYIKSTKNNLKSWGDLNSFLNTTDMFWKVMRDQSLKIAINFAKSAESSVGPGLHDRSYFLQIINAYIFELERDKIAEMSDTSKALLSLILGYSFHESNIEDSVKYQ